MTIVSEVEFIQNYMAIMESRFGRRVKIQIQKEPGLEKVMIPKLIIQPLVENGILHGLEPKKRVERFLSPLRRGKKKLVIAVEDDGVGADEAEIVKKMKDGDGGKDTFALKILMTESGSGMEIPTASVLSRNRGREQRVLVVMPLEEENDEADDC